MSQFFQFEADFVESLRCIPMQVRFKLDTCGVKLKLHQWNQFTQADREALVEMPCQSAAEIQQYHDFLHRMIQERTGETATDLPVEQHPDWEIENAIPDSVVAKVTTENTTLETVQWATLSPLQRFALIKLSRSNHENSNFMPAMREFGLI
ncbi:nitrate reductase associated protein [Alkalinema sp. FACHB-956]|uniref:nitrate reductase associated protein n=1 Tax=Alkalinema sp. FACHB-956 TaxID=2692768 RepID=UPI001685CE5E|nr:nitrate reductase associated protein [Alkalinema sp. FACHB-956]MBD2328206.1 nitrate reductase associated protein [Alkalinema sp. FACHB-956]